MFEYGAPLVWAWATETTFNRDSFRRSTLGFKDLMAWIGNASGSWHLVTSNLCGLSLLDERFRCLGVAYQLSLEQMSPQNPLTQVLTQAHSSSALSSFAISLVNNLGYSRFKQVTNSHPTPWLPLTRFLHHELQ